MSITEGDNYKTPGAESATSVFMINICRGFTMKETMCPGD